MCTKHVKHSFSTMSDIYWLKMVTVCKCQETQSQSNTDKDGVMVSKVQREHLNITLKTSRGISFLILTLL